MTTLECFAILWAVATVAMYVWLATLTDARLLRYWRALEGVLCVCKSERKVPMTRIVWPDQCPRCGSLSATALRLDGMRYDPERDHGLWESFRCNDCGEIWPFRIVYIVQRGRELGLGRGPERGQGPKLELEPNQKKVTL